MNITQDTLINQIADTENINAATVRQVIKSAENIIYDYLSSITPSEEINIRLFKGLTIKRKYIEKKTYSKGMFQNIDCQEHVNIKAYLSKYYIGQINQKIFSK